MKIRIGQGIDFHRLETGLKLWLGGVNIPSEKGCVAHSDGDVLIHAICDALLGAAGLRDIGYYFPDSSSEFKGIDSKILLERTYGLIREKGFKIINLDCTICLEKPKIASYVPEMRKTLSSIISTETENVTIKATTTEKMGFTGREEGIIGMAVVLLSKD
ncbi:MAG: 2-C-methyl-D-erythritol 2,4-cyclodiphosphate synthase [Bacteroidia bacterium]|nr:2-C-methyl-D-erythritol 2,4-cyclodiphosphate synthase [Bacteroidia bacterium]